MLQLNCITRLAYLVLCRHLLIGRDVGDDLLGCGVTKDQVLLQLAHISQVLGLYDPVDLAGNLYMH